MNKVNLNQAPEGLIPFPLPKDQYGHHGTWCETYCAMSPGGPSDCEMRREKTNDCVPDRRRDGLRVVYADPLGKKNGKPWPPGFRPPTQDATDKPE